MRRENVSQGDIRLHCATILIANGASDASHCDAAMSV